MSDNFLNLQLNRAVWIAMLKQEKFTDAVSYYENYKKSLNELVKKNIKKEAINQELTYSEKIFIEHIEKLAEKYFKDNDYANALIFYKYIYDLSPENNTNINNYMACLDKVEQYDLELILAKKLVEEKDNADNNKIISKVYEKTEDFLKAIEHYNRYLKFSGKTRLDAYDYNTIGCNYFNLYIKQSHNPSDAKNALSYFKNTLKFEPDSKVYLKNTIVAAMKTKDYSIEKECWEKFIKAGYLTADEEFTYCASCMRNGDIEGWKKHYGSRFSKTEATIYPKLPKPEWTGKEDISDSTLLVHYEQGYGDNFLMWGYMPRLTKIAKKVIYYIQNNAYDLLKNNDFGVEVYSQKNTDINKLEYD
ncbi:MAG: hypothetical protein LUH05_07915, partial [Candidatus Gastranaerophilales bacterium]|nr:hypothetical protein [Candidatus Gastranaerophilales bacterium]